LESVFSLPGYYYGPPSNPFEYGGYGRRPSVPRTATVEFQSAGDNGVTGHVTLQEVGGAVLLNGQIFGLKGGKHGFHVHQKGDLGNGCKNAGGHFNPFNKNHGAPTDAERHVGDLGNILTLTGSPFTPIMISDPQLSLDPNSEAFVGGRAIVIHGGEDDLGRGGNEASLKAGNAGPRVACGVIKV